MNPLMPPSGTQIVKTFLVASGKLVALRVGQSEQISHSFTMKGVLIEKCHRVAD